MMKENALYVVATPIGNLADLSPRAIEVLKNCDVVAAEDTRHSAKLMQHYRISTPLIPYHDHGNDQQTERLLVKLRAGESVGLISDAGTPLISDPGYRLVSAVRAESFKVIPIPGACALIAALSASGLPSDRFAFEGFPSSKQGARKAQFDEVKEDGRTLIYYESPHRIMDSLANMLEVFGEQRQAVLARELSKTYETFLSGTLAELLAQLKEDSNQQKGEMVIMVHGYRKDPDQDSLPPEATHTMAILLAELPVKQAAAIAAKLTGLKKNKLYQWAIEQQSNA